MRIALAQLNPCIGDLAGNVEQCLAAVETAASQRADLVLLPEMAIPGYPPRDILFDASFIEAVTAATADLAGRSAAGPPVVVGSLSPAETRPPGHPGLYNSALLLRGGEVRLAASKQLLPAYDVFHEPRWFLPGPPLPPITVAGRRLGVLVCEDLWDEGYDRHPPANLLAAGAELLLCLNASPYRRDVLPQRLYHARRPGCPLLYANLVGANDELIFDGRSFALDGRGQVVAQLAGFAPEVRVIEMEVGGTGSHLKPQPNSSSPPVPPKGGGKRQVPSFGGIGGSKSASKLTTLPGSGEEVGRKNLPVPHPEAELFQALVLGVADFARKNRLERAFLGLSGGIDSALVAIIAAEALGPARVTAVALPSRYSDPRSTRSARELADALGTGFEVVELEPLHAAAEEALGDLLAGGTAAENVQARLRGLILMSFVNRYGGFLLNTSNKTELALGYATLYGDMAGTLCPIADLTKLEVIRLARWLNQTRGLIPAFTLGRAPSAELRPGQVDPFDYAEVAPAMEQLVRENRTNPVLRRSEHKRWQMGVILKVSPKAFGSGRLVPITRR